MKKKIVSFGLQIFWVTS